MAQCGWTRFPGVGRAVAVVEVGHLRKVYGRTVAVDDVSFSVDEGEIFGLLGPNGAGKTTTVESVVGLRTADAGTIRVFGLDPVVDHAALRDRVGVQLQESAQPPKQRVEEALALYSSFYRQPADPARFMAALGLAEKGRSYYRELSGGQKQRLSIALALIGRPQLAVLDELSTGLDPQARRDVWELVRGLRDEGVTIMLVTHDMDEAEHLCDRVALVDSGRIVAIDTPAALAELAAGGKRVRFRPSAPFDDALLTELHEVRTLSHEGDWVVATGEGELANVVVLTLAQSGVVARDLVTGSAELEDAFLALTGRGIDLPAGGVGTPGAEIADTGPAVVTDSMGAGSGSRAPRRDDDAARDRERLAFRGWHTLVPRRGQDAPKVPRAAFRQLVANEARLMVRNPAVLFWSVAFPILLLLLFASLPGTNEPSKSFGGLTFFQVYLPVLIAFSLAMVSLVGLPLPLTAYRELGVLRRMKTTPVPPSWMLGAQLTLAAGMLLVVALVVIFGGSLAPHSHLPRQPFGFLLALVFAAPAMLAVGLWVASVARTQRAAGAIGGIILYPMLFFAGVWVPQEAMAPALRTVSHFTELGAGVQAMDTSIQGHFPPVGSFAVMLAWAAGFGWLAIRMFRWE